MKIIKIIVFFFFTYIFFILYIVFFKKNIISELISEKYYFEEMNYQNIINQKKNTYSNNIEKKIKILFSEKGILFFFDNELINQKITINLIRFSDKKLDIKKIFFLKKKKIIINNLKYGFYNLIIKLHKKKFLIEKKIFWNKKKSYFLVGNTVF